MNHPDEYTQQCASADSQAEAAERAQARGLTPEQADAIEVDRGVDALMQFWSDEDEQQ